MAPFTSSKAYCITANISLNYSILPDNMGIDQKPKEETSNRQTDNRAYRLKKFIHKNRLHFLTNNISESMLPIDFIQ